MTPLAGVLSVREDPVGGAVAATVKAWPEDGFLHNGEVVLLVHGFNDDQYEACAAFQTFINRLPRSLTPVWRFFWPGDADFGFLQGLGFLGYPSQIPDAKASAHRLAAFLAEAKQKAPGLVLILVGHSLGCRLILELLDTLRRMDPGTYPAIASIILLAAAVPVDLVKRPGGALRAGAEIAGERIVLHSTSDAVLDVAFPAGQRLAWTLGYEEGDYDEAVGLYGNPPDFPDRSIARDGNGHGDYWADPVAARTLAGKLGAAVAHTPETRATPRHTLPPATATAARALKSYRLAGGRWPGCRHCED